MGKKLSKWERRKERGETYFAAFPGPEVHILLFGMICRGIRVVTTPGGCSLLRG